MSKNAKKVSDAGQGDRKGDSVYDFLYCDSRRIGSFLAQFDASGDRVPWSGVAGGIDRRAFRQGPG